LIGPLAPRLAASLLAVAVIAAGPPCALADLPATARERYLRALARSTGSTADAVATLFAGTIAGNGSQPPPVARGSSENAGRDEEVGIAYQVFLAPGPGELIPVDPRRRTFSTGERLAVYLRTTHFGELAVSGASPDGHRVLLAPTSVRPGQLVRVGPLEFTGGSSVADIEVRWSPSAAPADARTRDIVAASDGRTDAPRSQASVADAPPRRLVAYPDAGATFFATDPVQAAESGSGRYRARTLAIELRHE
jgi:hypothetical protein